MPKINWDEIDQKNAYCTGYDDHPIKKDGLRFAANPKMHAAYWQGWNDAATEADADSNPSWADEGDDD